MLLLATALQGSADGRGQSAGRATRVSTTDAGAPEAGPRHAAAAVVGHVWRAEGQAVANATLRLRNLVSGRVEMTTTSDDSGEFTFADVEGGTYLVECIDDRGKVIAVGVTFSLAPGETVATFVRLASQERWAAGFFHSIAAAAISSAAGVGVTAIGSTGRPISPNR